LGWRKKRAAKNESTEALNFLPFFSVLSVNSSQQGTRSWSVNSLANSGLLIVGAVVLIVIVLFGGTIVGFVSGAFSSLNVAIANFFKQLGGSLGFNNTSPSPTPTPSGGSPNPTPTATGGGGNAAATAWFAFTLHFSDGTTQDLNMNPTFSIFPLSITWQGKDVSSMDVLIRLKVTGTNLGAWSTVSSQHIEIYLSPSTTPATSSTGSFSDNGNGWNSGASNTIQRTTISGATLDALFGEYGTGSWIFQTTGTVTLTMNGQQYSANMGQNDVTLQNSETLSVSSLTGNHLTTTQLTHK
jgi:hypothetical protein